MLYSYISSIEPAILWFYIIIIVFVIFFVVRIVQPTFAIVVAIIIALIIVSFFNEKREVKVEGRNRELEYKLVSLRPRPANFHMDSDLIEFFHNIREFREYNRDEYDNALMASDHILQMQADAEKGLKTMRLSNCEHSFDIANDFYTKALNSLHAIIYKTPIDESKVTYNKHQEAMKTFQLLLRRHIDEIHELCQKANGLNKKSGVPISTWTQLRYNKGPRAHDTMMSPFYNFFY